MVVFCTHLQGYILVNDYARCRGEENLIPSKINLSPKLGLIFQRSQDVSAFLGASVSEYVCVLGGCMVYRGSAGASIGMVFDSALSNGQSTLQRKQEELEGTFPVLFGMSSAMSAPSVL